jgi:putative FmdB family regulatory protein
MPIYAYKCESCGHAKDVLQKISDASLTECPACGAASFRKQVTAAGFQLKGSGWYATAASGGTRQRGLRRQTCRVRTQRACRSGACCCRHWRLWCILRLPLSTAPASPTRSIP